MSTMIVIVEGGSKYRAHLREIDRGAQVLVIKTADATSVVQLHFDNKAAVVDFHGVVLNALLAGSEGE